MKIERFEDLEVWRLSRELVKSIYKLTSKLSVVRENFKIAWRVYKIPTMSQS